MPVVTVIVGDGFGRRKVASGGFDIERVGERVARIGGASPVQVHQPVRGVDADAVKFGG